MDSFTLELLPLTLKVGISNCSAKAVLAFCDSYSELHKFFWDVYCGDKNWNLMQIFGSILRYVTYDMIIHFNFIFSANIIMLPSK